MAIAIAIPQVVQEHAIETASLWDSRDRLLHAPDVRLEGIGRTDKRIEAHLDGLAVAGADETATSELLAQDPGCGEVFAATAVALSANRTQLLDRALALVSDTPKLRRGLLSAFGWTSAQRLRGVVAELLYAGNGLRRLAGLTACAIHRVDPGVTPRLQDPDANLRARALRAAGELGLRHLVSLCARSMSDDDTHCKFWAAWSAVLLGDREEALDELKALSLEEGPDAGRACSLALHASDVGQGHSLLQTIASDPARKRQLIRGTGHVGDPRYVPMLIGYMEDDKFARLAGEAFSMITGLDLSLPPLYRPQPEDFDSGPTEDPEDENVDMDEDDGLPWPDRERAQRWWSANQARFVAGIRYFMGEPVSRELCIRVLKEGFQRQRIAAAEYLCLLQPGVMLFNTAAPAWRQQRWLSKLI